MVFEPSILLMDEPLGALDRKLREQIMRLHRASSALGASKPGERSVTDDR
jgi:ABC-type Fe3+/spermidine/putrescine transport system ATPase subunit